MDAIGGVSGSERSFRGKKILMFYSPVPALRAAREHPPLAPSNGGYTVR